MLELRLPPDYFDLTVDVTRTSESTIRITWDGGEQNIQLVFGWTQGGHNVLVIDTQVDSFATVIADIKFDSIDPDAEAEMLESVLETIASKYKSEHGRLGDFRTDHGVFTTPSSGDINKRGRVAADLARHRLFSAYESLVNP